MKVLAIMGTMRMKGDSWDVGLCIPTNVQNKKDLARRSSESDKSNAGK